MKEDDVAKLEIGDMLEVTGTARTEYDKNSLSPTPEKLVVKDDFPSIRHAHFVGLARRFLGKYHAAHPPAPFPSDELGDPAWLEVKGSVRLLRVRFDLYGKEHLVEPSQVERVTPIRPRTNVFGA